MFPHIPEKETLLLLEHLPVFCLQGKYPPAPLKKEKIPMPYPGLFEKTQVPMPSPHWQKGPNMSNENRSRRNELKLFLSDDEQYILEKKWKTSGMKSKSAFVRHLILYGYVYDVDYTYLHEYNTSLARIANSLNQIAKQMNTTGNVYEEDVTEIKEMMNTLWHTQKSMLSKQPCIKQ